MSTKRETLLTRTLVELADSLVADFDVVDLLTLLTGRCVELLDIGAAGIVLAAPHTPLRVMASSSDAVRILELFEIQANEGPSLDCLNGGFAVENGDLAAARPMWPTFVPEALAAGYRSVHVVPLRLRGTVIGALNLFNERVGFMEPSDIEVAQALADVATIAILQHRAAREAHVINEQLNLALNSRVVIEQAKGMISERESVEIEAAFQMLRQHARKHNIRLADLAADIVNGAAAPATLDRLG
jgi:GAF domain-containing protein